LVCAAALAAVACSSGGGGGAGAGGDGDGGSSGSSSGGSGASNGSSGSGTGSGSAGVSLTVVSADVTSTVGGLAPTSGNFFMVVSLTLKNTGAPNALSTNPVLFAIHTSQSLDVSASPAQPSAACNASVSVASGGQSECSVAFEMPTGQTPTDLVYNDERGDTASAMLPAVPTPSAACQTYAGWFKTQPSTACMSCIENADGVNDASGAACESAATAYGNACGGTCQSMCLPFSKADPCACELSCDSPSCHMLWDTYVSCLVNTCGPQCS